ncbi:C40 family peptidase [Streptomyces sp. NPDC048157]|uniref:C40 family peptidase n=1 Tax=Streptomyces sp. NPDC048157 TaxID=3365503 RepID=UPI00370FDC41
MTLLVLGGGIVMVWTGITDPENGLVGEIGRVLRGEKRPDSLKKKTSVSGADLASAILAYNPTDSGTGTGGAVQTDFQGGGGVVSVARQAIGTQYVWGGGNSSGPTKGGFDCSGLTQFAYKKGAGIDIPRTTEPQRLKSTRISASQAVSGDAVFFGAPAYHVGIYIGGGQMIHAPHTGAKVRIEKVSNVQPGPITYGRFQKTVSA